MLSGTGHRATPNFNRCAPYVYTGRCGMRSSIRMLSGVPQATRRPQLPTAAAQALAVSVMPQNCGISRQARARDLRRHLQAQQRHVGLAEAHVRVARSVVGELQRKHAAVHRVALPRDVLGVPAREAHGHTCI
jgi:hypothetical protein